MVDLYTGITSTNQGTKIIVLSFKDNLLTKGLALQIPKVKGTIIKKTSHRGRLGGGGVGFLGRLREFLVYLWLATSLSSGTLSPQSAPWTTPL